MFSKTSYLNQYFDKVYVLNLQKHTGRKLALLQKLGHLGISATFVESEKKDISHFYKEILKDARKQNFSRILCLKDEIFFHKDFENQFQKSISNIPQDWKLLAFGNTDFAYESICAIGIQKSIFDSILNEIIEENYKDEDTFSEIAKRYQESGFIIEPNLIIGENENLNDFNSSFERDLVSVIMPAFNAERTIEKSIRSILLQSYKDLEIIVANDASTDRTAEIVQKLIKEDKRIRLVSLDENKGVMLARNEALKLARGSFIAIQDADDVSLKNRIEKLLIPIYEKGMLLAMSSIYRSRCVPEELDVFDQVSMMNLVESKRIPNISGDYEHEDRPILGLQTSVYQRRVFEDFGIFEDYRVAGDSEYLERILFFQTQKVFKEPLNGFRFVELNESVPNTFEWLDETLLVSVQMNEQNITNQFKKRKKDLKEIKKKYRKKIAEGKIDAFQKLEKSNFPSLPLQSFNTIKIDSYQSEISQSQLNPKSSHQKIGAEIRDIHNSWSWRITAPLRWLINRLYQ